MEKIIIKLQSSELEQSEFIGVLCGIIYSKEIFPHNKDIVPFLNIVFNKSYLQYVLNSRTLIVARISKVIMTLDENELENSRKKVIKYFIIERNNKFHYQKKKNANDKLNVWLNGL